MPDINKQTKEENVRGSITKEITKEYSLHILILPKIESLCMFSVGLTHITTETL